DQSNALGDKIVMSNMRWGIRKPEVAIYRSIYEYLGFGENLVDVTEGTFEGGDAMIVDGICYIGVGARTSMEAVEEVARKIGEGLNYNGISIVAVVNEKHAKESAMYKSPTDEHMSVMHLDTFWGPLATGLSLGLSSEIDKRKIFVLKNNSRGVEKTEVCNFGDFLRLRNETELLAILPEEQESYASNFLNMGNGTIISPLEKNIRVKEMIEKNGVVKVESPNISQLVGGYGAVHCMTASIKRG
ncbi:MAG: arginine deiminase family protein, partial [bacterium]|nr:arginine deiminase family protein [bacterium]